MEEDEKVDPASLHSEQQSQSLPHQQIQAPPPPPLLVPPTVAPPQQQNQHQPNNRVHYTPNSHSDSTVVRQ